MVGGLVGCLHGWMDGWFVCLLAGLEGSLVVWKAVCLFLAGYMIGWIAGYMVGWLARWLVSLLVARLLLQFFGIVFPVLVREGDSVFVFLQFFQFL